MYVNRHWQPLFCVYLPHLSSSSFIFQIHTRLFAIPSSVGVNWKYGLGLIGIGTIFVLIRFCKHFSRLSSSLILQIITRLFACGMVRWALIGNMGQHWHRYFAFICMLIRFCSSYTLFRSYFKFTHVSL